MNQQSQQRPIAIWLLIGVGMIMIQVFLGGITRLTGSGLSITEWKPILGALPPMNEAAWETAFEKYKQIGQYKQIHFYFTLSDFKFIYFWEWFHREWARFMALVFAVGFVYFLVKKMFTRTMIRPMIILFLLGGLQGLLGWVMVKSGLNENDVYVSHIRLAIHFIAALGLLSYVLWFSLKLLLPENLGYFSLRMQLGIWGVLVLLIFQLVYGAFMAGMKAAVSAPTWPLINGKWVPQDFIQRNWVHDHLAVHFIHRGLAYLLTVLILLIVYNLHQHRVQPWVKKVSRIVAVILITQVVLGITTVMNATSPNALLWLGVAHQFVAMLLLTSWVILIYLTKQRKLKMV